MTLVIGGAAVSMVVLVLVLRLLQRPLLALLAELCDGEPRALFWWRVCTVELSLATALCATLALVGGTATPSWLAATAVVRGGGAGLLAGLAVLMVAMVAFEHQLAARAG